MKILISENQLKNIVKNILNESSGEDFYEKHYSDIDRDVFMKIVSADPQTKINNGVIDFIGKGGRWLIKLFKDGKLKRYKEDLPKANDYLKVYYKYKNKFKDISNFESLPDLYDSVKDYFAKADSSLKNILISLDESEYRKLYEDEKWIIYQPLSEKAACYIGVNTEWCTTYGEYSLNPRFVDRDDNAFNDYSDDLFIIINKNDENEKYQFHIRSGQYMDKNDDEINLKQFWKNNPKLSDFFAPFFEDILKKYGLFDEYGLRDDLMKSPPKTLNVILPQIIKEMNRMIQKFEDDGLNGGLDLHGFPLKQIPKHWVNVKGGLYLLNTQITSLGNLQYVGGYLNLLNTQITSLGNLKSVGRYLNLENTQITSLGNLESVGGYLNLQNTQITSLGNLESVGEDLFLRNTPITNLGNLQSVGGSFDLENTKITSLGNLQSVGLILKLQNTQITDLGNLQSVGGHLFLINTQITDLGNLKSVGGSFELENTQITSLGNLESVGGSFYLQNTQITDLGNLQYVGGYLYLKGTPLLEKYTIKELQEKYPQFKGKIKL